MVETVQRLYRRIHVLLLDEPTATITETEKEIIVLAHKGTHWQGVSIIHAYADRSVRGGRQDYRNAGWKSARNNKMPAILISTNYPDGWKETGKHEFESTVKLSGSGYEIS